MEQLSFPLNESQIQEFLRCNNTCLAVFGSGGRIIDVSVPTLNFFGFSSKEDYYKNYDELSPLYQPDGNSSKKTMLQMLESAFEHGHANFNWLHKNRSGLHMDCHIQMVSGEYAKEKVVCTFVQASYGNVSPSQAASNPSEVIERWTIISEALPIGINFWDENLNFLDGNEMGYKLFDFPSQEHWKKNWQDSMPEFQPDGSPSLEKMSDGFKKTVEEGSHHFEWLHYTIAGEPIPLDINMVRVKYKDGYMVVCILQDLRNLQESVAKIREAEKGKQYIYDSIPIPSSMWDENYNVLDCNEAMVKFLGLSSKDEALKRFYEFSTEHQPCGTPTLEKCRKIIDKVLSDGSTVKHHWTHLINGEAVPVEVTVERVPLGDGYICSCYATDLRMINTIMEREREAHELTQMILDSSPFVINLWDKSGNLLQTSHKALELHNVSCKEEYIKNFYKLSVERQPCGTLSSEMIPCYLDQAYQEGYAQFEWVHCTLDGKPIPTEITLVRFERQGDFMLVAYTTDLTLAKVAAQRERDANEINEIFRNASPLVMNIWDEHYNLVSTSQQAVTMFGLENQEQYIEQFFKLSPEYQPCGAPSNEKALHYVKEAFRTKEKITFEWMHQSLTGEPMPMEITLFHFTRQGKNMVAAFSADLRLVKAAMNMEREQELHERIRLFFDASPMGVSIYDENLRFVDCNMSNVTMFGFRDKQDFVVEFDKPFPVLSPEYQPCGTLSTKKSQEMFETVTSDGYAQFEWMHCDANGNELPTETTIVIVPYKNTFEIVSFIRDLREIKASLQKERAAEIAEASSKAKSRFLARMSHEIRTPITAVLGIAEIQLQNPNLSPEFEESFAKIYSSSNILLGIINDILDLSKIEADKMEVIEEEYDVASMISDIAHLHLSYIGNKDIVFHLDVNKNLPALLIGDTLRIKQIASNLLSNAFKYTESGAVNLSFQFKNDTENDGYITLSISISDTGLGMTKEQLDILHNEYTRFHEIERRYISGTGLGMSIVYSLTKMMGADIKIESEINKGTCVVVRISQKIAGHEVLGKEMVDSLQHFEMDTQAIVKRFKFTPEPMPYGNVLVVDDVETNLYVAQGLLAFYKLNIETCSNGYEAINKIRRGKVYDIIFMDYMMPGISGAETMHTMRSMGYAHPIVALTANALIGQAEEFIRSGFDGFISKPILTNQLNTILIKHIRDKQPPGVIEAAKATEKHSDNQESIHDYMDGAELKEKLRLKFVRSQKNAILQIRDAMEINDTKTAHRVAHTLKGLANLIGESSLAETAQAIESIFASNEMPTSVHLNDLENELNRVLKDIGKPEASPLSGGKILDKDRSMALLDRLEPLLKARNADCLMLLDELKEIPETAVLSRQINNFDFKQGLLTLEILKTIFEEQ